MHVVGYRYRVPPASHAAYLELQERVAQFYLAAGCEQYLILRPAAGGDEWAEFTFYTDRQAYREVERKLMESGVLDAPFQEFLRLTGLRESDLRTLEYETPLWHVRKRSE